MKSKVPAYPYFGWMAVFTIIPMLFVLYFAFIGDDGQFTLDGFRRLADPYMIAIFLKSLWLALLTTIICLLIAYPMAYILSRMKLNTQRTMMLLVMLPMWMNFLLRIYAWMMLLENNGLINKLLGFIGLGPFQLIGTTGAILAGMAYNFLPFMVLPIYSVMTKIDGSLIEASQDLGCNFFGVLRRILLPLSFPGVITGITMVFVPAASTFVISQRLGGSELMIGDVIEMYFVGAEPNFNTGASISLVLMLVILIGMGIMNLFDKDEMEGMLI